MWLAVGEVVVLRVAIEVPTRYGRGHGLGREGLYTAKSGRVPFSLLDPKLIGVRETQLVATQLTELLAVVEFDPLDHVARKVEFPFCTRYRNVYSTDLFIELIRIFEFFV